MKSPSFTLIAVGNMWSLIKNIFSVEIAFISWANFSWPSTHQSFFGKGNSSLWVSGCQATEQKEREGEGEKRLHACCRHLHRKAWNGRCSPEPCRCGARLGGGTGSAWPTSPVAGVGPLWEPGRPGGSCCADSLRA